jgi:hypothetical protein
VDASCVGFIDLVPLLWIDMRSLDVAPNVVVVVTGLGVDAAPAMIISLATGCCPQESPA